MTRGDAEALVADLEQRDDIISYGKHIPGFWEPYTKGRLRDAALALRVWLEKNPSAVNVLLLERLDALEAAHA